MVKTEEITRFHTDCRKELEMQLPEGENATLLEDFKKTKQDEF